MRIGVVTTLYPRHPGDHAGLFVREHVDWLRAQGHQVDVIAAGAGDGSSGVRWVDGGKLFAGSAPEHLERSRLGWVRAASFSARLTAALRRARPWDATIAHWLVPSGLCASLTTSGPMVAIAHSGDVAAIERTRSHLPVAAALARRASELVFVSADLRRRFLGKLPRGLRHNLESRTRVTPMGIEALRFSSAWVPRPPGRQPRVLFLGRLVAIKGAEHLIDAVAELGGRVELRIAGDGPLRGSLAERARTRGLSVEFLGAVAPEARHRVLADADVVVLPSVPGPRGRREGTPIVALEAIAAGASVVVSDTGGLAELPDELVHRVPPADVGALASAIRAALGKPPPSSARRQFLQAIDWSAIGPALLPQATRGGFGVHAALRNDLRGA